MSLQDEKKVPPDAVASSPPPSPPDIAEGKTVSERYADVTLGFVKQYAHTVEPLTPEKEARLLRKLYLSIMTLLLILNLMLFVDKATLSYASLLGIFDDTHINQTEYNNLNTLFYVGYIIAQAPGHYLMQRLPLGRFVGATVFLWAVIVFLHCAAYNYGGLIALRFFLGAVEATLVPAMEITLGMFFTPAEQGLLQPLFWTSCMGAPIPTGFIAYGLLYSRSYVPPWKLFMIVTGGITLLLAVYSWFFYPSNPVDAKFLSTEEKVWTIQRVHDATRSSIEQKRFKPHQFWETIRDPVSWLFVLQAFTLMIANNLAYQQNLLFLGIGVSDLGSTLVGVAGGGFAVACCIIATFLLRRFPNNNAYWATVWCLPAIAGGIGMVTVPWNQEIGLLACLTLASNTFGIAYIIGLGWTTSSAAGYTKKLTRNVLFMAGYGIANLISPQIWVARDAPRYYPAWIVQIVISWVGTPVILLIIRWILSRRNAERRAWIAAQEESGKHAVGFVEKTNEEGRPVKVEVEVSLLDLTDLENN
ncbi:allantoate permease of the major facilitator superfamily [Rasamsonia emersonii CBS 393.64]|uniref:Allantoate permease of the major facilitator superfamily n=1 Tax=Rasamsonia emersonii (strain ATCC 16479 / CBS 393.64 / IMI 116815) TaxID=1408163 RepID=A0A0F4YU14_RASE3|nr:allantoate permease of the major facilitator superfamily [Rasamsonia emersonii CBS 393.64]KKA21767.1 allantoate permease of the major facilitator superfamily [Rasamsonia emersonii CBS 393.64]